MNTKHHGPLIEGEIADYVFDVSSGILFSYPKSIKRTVENIRRNSELVKKISGDKRIPILMYVSPSPIPDKVTRRFSREMLPQIYTAVAVVSKPRLSNWIMNVLFRFHRPKVPVRTFSDANKAVEWLKGFVD